MELYTSVLSYACIQMRSFACPGHVREGVADIISGQNSRRDAWTDAEGRGFSSEAGRGVQQCRRDHEKQTWQEGNVKRFERGLLGRMQSGCVILRGLGRWVEKEKVEKGRYEGRKFSKNSKKGAWKHDESGRLLMRMLIE